MELKIKKVEIDNPFDFWNLTDFIHLFDYVLQKYNQQIKLENQCSLICLLRYLEPIEALHFLFETKDLKEQEIRFFLEQELIQNKEKIHFDYRLFSILHVMSEAYPNLFEKPKLHQIRVTNFSQFDSIQVSKKIQTIKYFENRLLPHINNQNVDFLESVFWMKNYLKNGEISFYVSDFWLKPIKVEHNYSNINQNEQDQKTYHNFSIISI